MMRATLPATLLLCALLAACASDRDIPVSKEVSQRGPLKINPALLSQGKSSESLKTSGALRPESAEDAARELPLRSESKLDTAPPAAQH